MGAFVVGNAAAHSLRTSVLESPPDSSVGRRGQTRLAVDCSDWPWPFVGRVWRFGDRASPTGRTLPSGRDCPPRETSTSVCRRFVQKSRPYAKSRIFASFRPEAVAALPDRNAGSSARWWYGRPPDLAPPSAL